MSDREWREGDRGWREGDIGWIEGDRGWKEGDRGWREGERGCIQYSKRGLNIALYRDIISFFRCMLCFS